MKRRASVLCGSGYVNGVSCFFKNHRRRFVINADRFAIFLRLRDNDSPTPQIIDNDSRSRTRSVIDRLIYIYKDEECNDTKLHYLSASIKLNQA